jgi:hypothetical protein
MLLPDDLNLIMGSNHHGMYILPHMYHDAQTPTSPNNRTQGEMIKSRAEIKEIKLKEMQRNQ